MKCNTRSMVKNTANSKFEFCRSRIIRPDNWSCRRNGDSVVEKHAQTMLQLMKFGIDGIFGELSQIVNIPVTQIVEEIADREYSSYSDCGRDRRGEQILD